MDIQNRSHDLDWDTVLDILDDEELDDKPEPWQELQDPDEAAMCRKRSMNLTSKECSKEPETKIAKLRSKTVHVNVSPHQRVKEFPAEFLAVSTGKLFCDACHHAVNLKKSIIEKHIQSQTHQTAKQKRKDEAPAAENCPKLGQLSRSPCRSTLWYRA